MLKNGVVLSLALLVVMGFDAMAFFRKKPTPPASSNPSGTPPAPVIIPTIPSAFVGSYNYLLVGWTYGSERGLFAFGTATVSSTGVVAYSIYKPARNTTSFGQGFINGSGLFSFSNGVSGSTTILNGQVGYGTFVDVGGGGYFGIGR